MRSKLDLPIEAPSWLSVENRTDESAVMLDTNDELVLLLLTGYDEPYAITQADNPVVGQNNDTLKQAAND